MTLGGRMSYGYPGPGGEQQPQQGPGWGGPPPQPPKKNTGKVIGFGCLGVVAAVVVLGVIGAAVGGGDDDKDSKADAVKASSAPADPKGDAPKETSAAPKEAAGPDGDVKITGCEVDSMTSWASADVLIKNRSSKRSNYIVSVEFVDGSGKRLGEAMASTNNLAPGQESEEKAQGLDKITGKISCKVTDVTRYAS